MPPGTKHQAHGPDIVLVGVVAFAAAAPAVEPVPDKIVVLTFDDASKSHYTVGRPLLKKHKFGATFFVTEGWDFATNKKDYMSWDEIAQLHKDGFEIGNHTRDHQGVSDRTLRDLPAQSPFELTTDNWKPTVYPLRNRVLSRR